MLAYEVRKTLRDILTEQLPSGRPSRKARRMRAAWHLYEVRNQMARKGYDRRTVQLMRRKSESADAAV